MPSPVIISSGVAVSASPIPDVTEIEAGVMSAADKAALDALTSSRPALLNTKKSIANGVATPLFTVDMSKVSDNSFASIVNFGAEATDGTEVQIRSGSVNANIAAKGGAYTTSTAQSATQSSTAGNLTLVFSWTSVGQLLTFNVTPTSTVITPTEEHINFYMPFATHPGVVALA